MPGFEPGSSELEATALSTVPQPLAAKRYLQSKSFLIKSRF